MRAVRIHEFGPADVLRLETCPKPAPGIGEILVRVHAAGVNPVDAKLRSGQRKETYNRTLPAILGWDASGVVAQCGAGASRFAESDAVYARLDLAREGTYAEYAVVKESEAAAKPRTLSHTEAAALPLAGLTAWQAIEAGDLQADQRILIHAAAGGVGHLAVQIAKARGAYVIGTASARNHALLKDLGADEIIDYTTTKFEDAVRDVDMVLHTMDPPVLARSWSILRQGGILVSVTDAPSEEIAAQHGVRALRPRIRPNADHLEAMAQLCDASKLKPVVTKILPLAEARAAHEAIETGHTAGKIVLQII